MATYRIESTTLEDIADAIRSKTGQTGPVKVTDISTVIETMETAPELPTLSDEGSASDLLSGKQLIDGEGNVVEGTIPTKTASDLTASDATVTVPAGYYATDSTKSVTTATRASTTISSTANNTNDALTITASNNQATGYVTGSDQTATKTVTLTASGATVTASDGTTSISKSVATGTATTPATTITNTPTISVNSSGLITASVSGTQNVTPTVSAGYISSGTSGTITVSGSATKQLTTQAAKTITPTKSSQTAVAKDVYTTGAVTVGAIPNEYITTTDATATSANILSGKTAYVNGEKITGNFTIENELTEQTELISQIVALASTKATLPSIDTSDATATASDILSGKTAYVKGEKVTGNIATKTSSNLTASGATVTVPAGYYASQATKSVSSGSATTPATTVTKNPSISVSSSGLITASVSGTQSVTPTVSAGYVSSGTAGTITVSGSATKQLTTQAAQTITPGTSDKTISSGRYLTGTQTIKGDSNLIAGNIKKGTSIFGVTGTYEGSGGSGGSVETCTCSMLADKYAGPGAGMDTIIHYIDSNMEYKTIGYSVGSTFSCVKGSLIYLSTWSSTASCDGMIQSVFYSMGNAVYYVNGDFSLYAAD